MFRLEPYSAPQFRSFLDAGVDVPQHLNRLLPPRSRGWSISPELGVLLYRLVTEHDRRRVLEFGAGSSSVLLAAALSERGGGLLTSIEESPEWCADQWDLVRTTATVDAELIAARPQLAWHAAALAYIYESARPRIEARGPYDLVLIDAPQYYYGRDGALAASHAQLRAGTLIVLDDAGRSAEQWSIRRWLRTYPGLELRLYAPTFGGKGVAVLEVVRPLRPRANALTAISSYYHVVEHWTKRRKRRKRAKNEH